HTAQHESRARRVHREGCGSREAPRRRTRRHRPYAPRSARPSGPRPHDRPNSSGPELMRSRATLAWSAYLIPASALALYALVQWLVALVNRIPVLYGEGAVANAARLARDGIAYLDPDPERFVAANYPPLYFHLASIIDPFVSGRIASIAATLAVAAMVFVTARSAGRLAAAGLAAGWLALAPVMIWGAALKPDLIALGLTAL